MLHRYSNCYSSSNRNSMSPSCQVADARVLAFSFFQRGYSAIPMMALLFECEGAWESVYRMNDTGPIQRIPDRSDVHVQFFQMFLYKCRCHIRI